MTTTGRPPGFDLDGFCARLSEEVARRGGQKQVSELLGIHRQDLYRVMTGRCVPRLDRAVHIAATLDVDLGWLVTGRSEPLTDVAREARALDASLARVAVELDRSRELGQNLVDSTGRRAEPGEAARG